MRYVYSSTDNPTDIIQIDIGALKVNRADRSAIIADQPVGLTAGDFALLWYLAQRAGQVVSREVLYREVLKAEYDGQNRCLDLRISRLRKRLGDTDRSRRLIKSIRCEGYLLADGQC
jgi:DNA-binding response OmpR family regulator